MIDNIDSEWFQLPEWADRISDGTYMVKGTQLCTRDGRRMGNAVVTSNPYRVYELTVVNVRTDKNNQFAHTLSELEGCFHVPTLVMKEGEYKDTEDRCWRGQE